MTQFKALLQKIRQSTHNPQTKRFLSQEAVAEKLALVMNLGDRFSGRTVSNWERGVNKIGQRKILIALLKIYWEYGGYTSLAEANRLLESGDYRRLNQEEGGEINPDWVSLIEAQESIDSPTAEVQVKQLPRPAENRLFGIESIITELLARLMANEGVPIHVVTGLAGVGKTAVLHTTAHRAVASNHFHQVIFYTVDPRHKQPSFNQIITAIYRAIFTESSGNKPVEQKLDLLKYDLTQHNYLIVIDNLQTTVATTKLVEQLIQFGFTSRFLLGSQQQPDGLANHLSMTLNGLATPDAIALLRYHAGQRSMYRLAAMNNQELTEIVQTLGGHPFALKLTLQLADRIPLADLLAGWERNRIRQISQAYDRLFHHLWTDLSVREISLLQQLRLLSVSGGTVDYLTSVLQIDRFTCLDVIQRLLDLCLVEQHADDAGGFRIILHSLTRNYIQSQDIANGRPFPYTAEQIERHLQYWLSFVKQRSSAKRGWFDKEHPNMFAVFNASLQLPDKERTEQTNHLWLRLAEEVTQTTQQHGYAAIWSAILANLTGKFHNHPLHYCQLLNRLGTVYSQCQQPEEAINSHEQAMEIATKHNATIEIAEAYFGLALAHYHAQSYLESIEHSQLACQIFEKNVAQPNRKLAAALNLYGLTKQKVNDLEDSIKALNNACDIWSQLDLKPEWVRTLNNLAIAYRQAGNIDKAISCYQKANPLLQMFDSRLDQALVAISESRLYFVLGDYAKAESILVRVDIAYLKRAEQFLYRAFILNNLGQVLIKLDRLEEAQTFIEDSIQDWKHINHETELANTISGLGKLYEMKKDFNQARHLYLQALSLTENRPKEHVRANKIYKSTLESLTQLDEFIEANN